MAISKKYKIAYSEIIEILKYIPKDELEKIPEEKIDYYNKNKDENHNFKYDVNKSLEEQNVSEITKGIIIILFRDYIANTSQKEMIINRQKEDLRKREIEKSKLYNKDIFYNNQDAQTQNEKEINCENMNDNVKLKEKSKNKDIFINKIINKIRKFLKM